MIEEGLFFDQDYGVLFQCIDIKPISNHSWVVDFSRARKCVLTPETVDLLKKTINVVALKRQTESKLREVTLPGFFPMKDVAELLEE